MGEGHEVDTADDSAEDQGPAIGTTGARFGGAPRRRRTARRKKAAEADGTPAVETAPEADTVAIPVVPPGPAPRAGARMHGAPAEALAPVGRAEPPPEVEVPDVEVSDVEEHGGPVVGLTGARFGGAPKERKRGPVAEEPFAGGSAAVRPYVFTRGRTRSAFQLSIETLVSAVPQSRTTSLTSEHHALLGLCREPRSVAELAARVGVPLGVARVLVGDLAAAGAVAVHRVAGSDGPDLALMERVLSGLRKL
jgi:hypothetical protein